MNTLMVFYKFYLDYTHFLISNDVILVFYMSSTEFALPMFVYFDYHLFRWCSIESFSWMAQFCHSVRKCHSTTNVQTYCHFLWWHYTILTFDIKMWITSYTNKVKDKGNTSKKKKKKKKKKTENKLRPSTKFACTASTLFKQDLLIVMPSILTFVVKVITYSSCTTNIPGCQ